MQPERPMKYTNDTTLSNYTNTKIKTSEPPRGLQPTLAFDAYNPYLSYWSLNDVTSLPLWLTVTPGPSYTKPGPQER